MYNVNTICVCGAGTMGSGIAQVAAQAGFNTIQFDVNTAMIEKSKASIEKSVQFLVEKQKISSEEKADIFSRILFTSDIKNCVADLCIEAIIENKAAKIALFNDLALINSQQTIFATNTSSISVGTIAEDVANPAMVVGLHFFNPATIMKLVEVVQAEKTDAIVVETMVAICKQMNKVPVICKDAPGFIVNRVARHYYLEAMNLVEQGNATIENVDELMEATGFKMGPFKLMDLIGMDINLAVTQSLYHAFNGEERFKPSSLQINKVAANELGKKTGKGFYNYT